MTDIATTQPATSTLQFLSGGGEMGALMRSHDWATSALGSPADWPAPLRTVVRLMLNTRHPMYVFWGKQGHCLYNDAYRASIGSERHPNSLGRPACEVWQEIWPIIGPQVEQVMAGDGATWHENALVPITRDGQLDDVYWTYSYSPIDQEDAPSGVGGVLVICTETTAQIAAEHSLKEEASRAQRLFAQAPGFICTMRGPDHVFDFVNEAHKRLFNSEGWIGKPVREAFPDISGQGFVEHLDEVFQTGQQHVALDAPAHYRLSPDHPFQTTYMDFIYAPIIENDGAIGGVFCEGHDVTAAHNARARLVEAARTQSLLVDELNHRVKNTLAIVQSLAKQTFRSGGSETERQAFEGRLVALASAHDLLTEDSWESADLREIVHRALHGHAVNFNRVSIQGPALRIEPRTAVTVSLAIHELATNARKYGALSTSAGCIDLRWSVSDSEVPRLLFRWQEIGGPPVTEPKRRGFGTKMIERSLAMEFGGKVTLSFAPTGVICEIDAPLPSATSKVDLGLMDRMGRRSLLT